MGLEHEPLVENRTVAAPVVEPHSDTGAQLASAREADAAWRAAKKARFKNSLLWLKRGAVLMELGLGVLAMTIFILGFGASNIPFLVSEIDSTGERVRHHGLLYLAAFILVVMAALPVRRVSRWLASRIRSRAAVEAVDLDD